MKSVERKPRRIAVAILSVIVIAIMWQNKDVLGLWNGISAEDILPLFVTKKWMKTLFLLLKITHQHNYRLWCNHLYTYPNYHPLK